MPNTSFARLCKVFDQSNGLEKFKELLPYATAEVLLQVRNFLQPSSPDHLTNYVWFEAAATADGMIARELFKRGVRCEVSANTKNATPPVPKPRKGFHHCGEQLHYEQLCGIRLFKFDENDQKFYKAKCPKCHEYFEEKAGN